MVATRRRSARPYLVPQSPRGCLDRMPGVTPKARRVSGGIALRPHRGGPELPAPFGTDGVGRFGDSWCHGWSSIGYTWLHLRDLSVVHAPVQDPFDSGRYPEAVPLPVLRARWRELLHERAEEVHGGARRAACHHKAQDRNEAADAALGPGRVERRPSRDRKVRMLRRIDPARRRLQVALLSVLWEARRSQLDHGAIQPRCRRRIEFGRRLDVVGHRRHHIEAGCVEMHHQRSMLFDYIKEGIVLLLKTAWV